MLLAKITIHITVRVPFGIAYCMNSIDSLARTPIENNVFKVSLVKNAKKTCLSNRKNSKLYPLVIMKRINASINKFFYFVSTYIYIYIIEMTYI